MRARNVLCVAAIVVLALSAATSAELVVYDHFTEPAAAINPGLWDVAGTGASVTGSVATVVPTGVGGWTELTSTQTYAPYVVGRSYEFLYQGSSGGEGIMGIAGGGGSAYIRNFGGWRCTAGASMGAVFTPVAGDKLDLFYDGYDWIVERNDVMVSWASGNGGFTGNATLLLATASNGSVSVDYVGIREAIPEPSVFVLLSAGLVSLLAYAWKKRR